jgi:ERF superfamily
MITTELLAAMTKASAGYSQIVKDKVNPFHKSKYASLESVMAAVNPALHANGLCLTASMSIEDGQPCITMCLYHESGGFLQSRLPLPISGDPQKLGSLITYYRRYLICSLLNVQADADDDGNSSSTQDLKGSHGSEAPSRTVTKPVGSTATSRLKEEYIEMSKGFTGDRARFNHSLGFGDPKDWTPDNFNEAIKKMEEALGGSPL